MNTIQFLEAGSTELDPTLVNIWQSDQGSPRFISLHGITLRTALPGCACLLQAKPAAGTRDGWKTCGRIGETAGHPDGHPPQRALPDTFRWIGTAVDWESRDQTMAHPAPTRRAQDRAKRRHRPDRKGMLADRRSAPSRLAPASRSERRCRPLQVNGRSASLLTPRVADAANGTLLHHTFPPSCGITTVTRR